MSKRPHISTALTALSAITIALLAYASPAGAAKSLPAHRPAPQCADLGHVSTGVHAWLDDHSVRSPLVTNLDRLVCSAADGATIDIKSWFILVDGPVVRHLVADLALMHRYHRVAVNVFVGTNWYARSNMARAWPVFLKAFSFAHVASCRFSCQSTTIEGSDHSKWVSVSRLKQGGTAVLSTSMNISTQQYGTGQTGTFTARNTPLYNAFVARFAAYEACSANPSAAACGQRTTSTQPAARWLGAHGTYVFFAPVSTDPIAATLSRVSCAGSRTHHLIQLASLLFTRAAIVEQLIRLRASGCVVRVLQEHTPVQPVEQFHPRCELNHDKTLIIDTPRTRVVFTGADDFTNWSLQVSDNQTIRTTSPSVITAYERFYKTLWSRSKPC